MLFGNAAQNMAKDAVMHADLNHNGEADVEELTPAFNQLKLSVNDFVSAVDAVAVGKGFENLMAGLASAEAAIGADVMKKGVSPEAAVAAFQDPKVAASALECLAALKEIVAGVDQAKAGKAFGELQVVHQELNAYMHPKHA